MSFTIELPAEPGEWFFQRPDGRAIPQGPIYRENVSAETIVMDTYKYTDTHVSAETFTQVLQIEEPQVSYG